jgi:hypothetical protein
MSFEVRTALYGVLLPLAVAVAVLHAARHVRHRGHEWLNVSAGAAAFGAAFLLGYVLLGLEPLRPALARQWIPYLVLVALAVGAVEGSFHLAWWVRVPAHLGVAVLAAWLIIPDWPALASTRLLWRMALAASVLAVWVALNSLALYYRVGPSIFLVGLILVGAGVVLERAGIMKFVQVIGLGGGAMLGFLFVSWRWPERRFLQGANPGTAMLLCSTVLSGQLSHFSEVPGVSFTLVLLAPVLLALTLLLISERWSQRKRFLVMLATVLVPILLAIGLAVWSGGQGGEF